MIKVTRIETVYGWDEDAGYAISDEGDATVRDTELTFRELVREMRNFGEVSCWPANGDVSEWLIVREDDYRTGGWIEESLHFSRDQPARRAKYWRKAMQAAGFAA
jgi:hypothetical protein